MSSLDKSYRRAAWILAIGCEALVVVELALLLQFLALPELAGWRKIATLLVMPVYLLPPIMMLVAFRINLQKKERTNGC